MEPSFPTQITEPSGRRELKVWDSGRDLELDAIVVWQRIADTREVALSLPDGHDIRATSEVDFEEAISNLRTRLEARGLLLACNRFRIDAFVSSMSRQMSDGLACYLVEMGRPVDPSQLVEALAPTAREAVVDAPAAAEYVKTWIQTFNDA